MDLPKTPFGSLFQCLTLFMGKKLILISSLNLFSFSSCLLSHPPAVQPCEKSGFTFLVMSLQALKDAVKPIPKPCPLQAAAAQLVQPLLRGQVCQLLISWSSFAEVISISPCLNQNCYCFVLKFCVPLWLSGLFLGQQEEEWHRWKALTSCAVSCYLCADLPLVTHLCCGLTEVQAFVSSWKYHVPPGLLLWQAQPWVSGYAIHCSFSWCFPTQVCPFILHSYQTLYFHHRSLCYKHWHIYHPRMKHKKGQYLR